MKYSLHRTLCNLDIFTAYIYSSSSALRTWGKLWAVFYGTLYNTGIFRTESYSEPYQISKTLLRFMCDRAYLKPWYIHNLTHIHNTVKRLLWNILFKSLCNLVIFRTLVYSQLWYILKSKHIQSTTAYLRSSILLKSLCNYSKSRRLIYSKLSLIQNSSVSATP